MIKTELSLEVSTSPNVKVMRLYDTSHYYSDEDVSNYLVQVLPTGRTTWMTFNVAKGFSLALNSSNLGFKKASDASALIALPDGIYEIKQSFKPNVHTLVHFFHFRITDILNQINNQKRKLLEKECRLTREEYAVSVDKLRNIEDYANAAKYSVEECGDKNSGKELYKFAKELLEKYTHECKC